jgi:hypothetical protein
VQILALGPAVYFISLKPQKQSCFLKTSTLIFLFEEKMVNELNSGLQFVN